MQIQINPGDVHVSSEVENQVEDEVRSALRLFSDQVTRVEVHLRDLNGPKSGVDKRCVMEARLAGLDPLAVEEDARELNEAIRGAAGKLERAVRRTLERIRDRRS